MRALLQAKFYPTVKRGVFYLIFLAFGAKILNVFLDEKNFVLYNTFKKNAQNGKNIKWW